MAFAGLMLVAQWWIFAAAAGFASGQAHTVTVEGCGSDEASPPAHDQNCTFGEYQGGYTFGFDWEGDIQTISVVDGPTLPCGQRGECPEGPSWYYAAPKAEDLAELTVATIALVGGGVWLQRSRRAAVPQPA